MWQWRYTSDDKVHPNLILVVKQSKDIEGGKSTPALNPQVMIQKWWLTGDKENKTS